MVLDMHGGAQLSHYHLMDLRLPCFISPSIDAELTSSLKHLNIIFIFYAGMMNSQPLYHPLI